MPKEYTVKAGDTLQKIAVDHCGSIGMVPYIVKDNKLPNADAIVPGMVLILNCDEDFTEIVPMPPALEDEDTSS